MSLLQILVGFQQILQIKWLNTRFDCPKSWRMYVFWSDEYNIIILQCLPKSDKSLLQKLKSFLIRHHYG